VGKLVIWGTDVWEAIASCRRGICIWLGFVILLLLAFSPPWIQTTKVGYGETLRTFHYKLWHSPVSHQPQAPYMGWRSWSTVEVDYPRMLTEIAVGECFVLALYLTWGKKGNGRGDR